MGKNPIAYICCMLYNLNKRNFQKKRTERDAKDMKYVQKNYLKQNQHMDDSPSPRKQHQGKH
jgi:hypothetical protein